MVEHELMDEVNRLDALSAEAADEFGYYALEEPTTYGVRRTSRRLDLGLTDPDGCHRAKRDRFCAKWLRDDWTYYRFMGRQMRT